MIALEWQDVTPVGFFLVGIVIGGFAVLRVFRYAVEWLRHDSQRHALPPRTPVGEREDDSGN